MNFLLVSLLTFIFWIGSSLLAIAFIGDKPYLGLAIAGLGGTALGFFGIAGYSSSHRRMPIEQMGKDGSSLCKPFPSGSEDMTQIQADRGIRESAAAQLGAKARRMALYCTVQYGAEWIATHELWFLALAVPLLIFPNRAASLGVLLISVLWVIRWVARSHISVRTPVDVPIVALLVMIPVALLASVDLEMSRIALCQILAGVALFYGLANSLHSEKDVWQMAVLLAFAGAGVAVIGPLGVGPLETGWDSGTFFDLPGLYERFPVPLPDTINANVLAGALAAVLPVGISLFLATDSSFLSRRRVLITRALLGLAVMLMLATFIPIQSVGGYLALAIGLLLLAVLLNRWFLVVPVLAVLGFLVLIQRLGVTQFTDFLIATDPLSRFGVRHGIWARVLYMIQEFPYTGIGLGAFRKVALMMYPNFFSPSWGTHAHNLFLQVAVDLGLPGLVAFSGVFSGTSMIAWKAYRAFGAQGKTPLRALASGLLASLLVIGVHGLVDVVTWDAKSAIIPWCIMGLAIALYEVLEIPSSPIGLCE